MSSDRSHPVPTQQMFSNQQAWLVALKYLVTQQQQKKNVTTHCHCATVPLWVCFQLQTLKKERWERYNQLSNSQGIWFLPWEVAKYRLLGPPNEDPDGRKWWKNESFMMLYANIIPSPWPRGGPICNLHFWHLDDLKNVTLHFWGKAQKM